MAKMMQDLEREAQRALLALQRARRAEEEAYHAEKAAKKARSPFLEARTADAAAALAAMKRATRALASAMDREAAAQDAADRARRQGIVGYVLPGGVVACVDCAAATYPAELDAPVKIGVGVLTTAEGSMTCEVGTCTAQIGEGVPA